MRSPISETTQLISDLGRGDAVAADRLFGLVYDELRQLAGSHFRNQPGDHTLQPTALVHEAFMKMADQTSLQWKDRAQFFALASRVMRQILIDHARGRNTAKRGGTWRRVSLSEADQRRPHDPDVDLVALDDALARLAGLNERQSRIVELRFFGGLSVDEVAHVLDISPRTVELDWHMAKAWLSRELSTEMS